MCLVPNDLYSISSLSSLQSPAVPYSTKRIVRKLMLPTESVNIIQHTNDFMSCTITKVSKCLLKIGWKFLMNADYDWFQKSGQTTAACKNPYTLQSLCKKFTDYDCSQKQRPKVVHQITCIIMDLNLQPCPPNNEATLQQQHQTLHPSNDAPPSLHTTIHPTIIRTVAAQVIPVATFLLCKTYFNFASLSRVNMT